MVYVRGRRNSGRVAHRDFNIVERFAFELLDDSNGKFRVNWIQETQPVIAEVGNFSRAPELSVSLFRQIVIRINSKRTSVTRRCYIAKERTCADLLVCSLEMFQHQLPEKAEYDSIRTEEEFADID